MNENFLLTLPEGKFTQEDRSVYVPHPETHKPSSHTKSWLNIINSELIVFFNYYPQKSH